jgi:RNA polymerase sigma factor (sigma-70 family)
MSRALEEVFRRSSGALVATLTRAFGPAHLDLVESVVQEAFVRAMEEWKVEIPSNPSGWLLRVAKNLALDELRRGQAFRAREDAVAHHIESAAATAVDEPTLRGELADDQLKMIFVACHPCNTLASQIVLALRTLCGLEVRAIARALYASDDAIEKRLVLARKRLREENVRFDLPPPSDLATRLDAVMGVLYISFSEAHWMTSGPDLVDEEVAAETMRLVSFLAAHPATRRPRVLALLALMHFHAARFPARVDDQGFPVALPDQDRSRWSRALVDEGLRLLAASAEGGEASAYHFEAAIAAVHATSSSIEATDWARIVSFYDELVARYPSPSARLSRAIALGFRDGPSAGLRELDGLANDAVLAELAAFHAARADVHARQGRRAPALAAYTRARELSTNACEQRYLERRLTSLETAR